MQFRQLLRVYEPTNAHFFCTDQLNKVWFSHVLSARHSVQAALWRVLASTKTNAVWHWDLDLTLSVLFSHDNALSSHFKNTPHNTQSRDRDGRHDGKHVYKINNSMYSTTNTYSLAVVMALTFLDFSFSHQKKPQQPSLSQICNFSHLYGHHHQFIPSVSNGCKKRMPKSN